MAPPICTVPNEAQSTCPCSPTKVRNRRESFPRPGTQGGHQAAQRHYAARVTAGADHLVNAGSAKAWVLLESLADELDIGISYPGPHDLASVEAFGFECPLHRLVVQTQLIGYGCDLPVLGKEESADVAPQLGVDHALPPVKGVDKAPGATATHTSRSETRSGTPKSTCMSVLLTPPGKTSRL